MSRKTGASLVDRSLNYVIPIGRADFATNSIEREQREAREKYVKACNDMARNLTEAAQRAEAGQYVSETVMCSSLVQDITVFAIEYRKAGSTLALLRFLSEED